MTQIKYDEVHLFIDESGNMLNAQDILLVGGVALFGVYSNAEDQVFKNFLATSLANVGGKYPEDLHFSKSSLSANQQASLLSLLSSGIASLASYNHLLYAFSIRHISDYHVNQLFFADEKYFDNRYVQMLWALIEQTVFVDDKLSALLNQSAKIHFHISLRGFPCSLNTQQKAILKKSGYNVVVDINNKKNNFVSLSLSEREIMGMLRMALNQRWKNSKFQFEFDVIKTDYIGGNSPIPLYLADIYLGTIRNSLINTIQKSMSFVPTHWQIEYGPWLEILAEMKAALVNRQVDQFLTLADQYSINYSHMNQFSKILESFEREAASLLKSTPNKFLMYMKDACNEIDQPGLARSGMIKADHILHLMDISDTPDIAASILYLQARLSHANHTGDVVIAESIWSEYETKELELYKLGAEGLRIMAEMRNRRAVSLSDIFCYNEAIEVLFKIIFDSEEELELHAKRFNIAISDLPYYELGACYGTLGQTYAFIGTVESRDKAAGAFARAITRFTEPRDQERQYIYLGHLACDMGIERRKLWDRVGEKLPQIKQLAPINENGLQFLLHLQIKGMLVFGQNKELIEFLSQWESCKKNLNYSDEETARHPFGLIYQAIAMAYARLWRESGQQQEYAQLAHNYFKMATETMEDGGALLQLLAYVADIRRQLFALEIASIEKLKSLLNSFDAHIAKHFAKHTSASCQFNTDKQTVSDDAETKAKSILSAIRFNYW